MAKAAKIKVPAFKTSGYAGLDVTTGREALKRHLEKGHQVRATIEVVIKYAATQNDGTSIEFCCDVEQIKNIKAA